MKTTSLALSQRLKSLGVQQKSLFYIDEQDGDITYGMFTVPTFTGHTFISAFTSDELGEWLLPFIVKEGISHYIEISVGNYSNGKKQEWLVEYNGLNTTAHYTEADTLAEAMGLMLENLIINGYVKVEDLK